jgi:hypothetical protein
VDMLGGGAHLLKVRGQPRPKFVNPAPIRSRRYTMGSQALGGMLYSERANERFSVNTSSTQRLVVCSTMNNCSGKVG